MKKNAMPGPELDLGLGKKRAIKDITGTMEEHEYGL